MAETRTIRTVLELNAQRFNAGAASAAASAKTLAGELSRVSDAQGKHRADYDRVANSLLGIGAAAAAGLGLAAKASMDWESSWAGVTKTVSGTPQQLKAVEDGLRGLARELPASHTEIAAVAEAAGQLGVQTDSIVDFTRTMINLGETTNLSAEEAATSLARFSNVMGTNQGDVDRLGSALVGLGNNFETTEGEIMAMGMRLSGIGSQLGLTEGDVLGLAAAMSSVGIEAEAGGTAMTMGMKKIDAAVRGGGDSLAGFAEVAGMSNEEFAKLWSEDSAAGLEAFVHGLADAGAQGESMSAVLSDLGIKGIRESDTFLRLASNADGFSEALALGNAEFEKNLALTEEATKRYQTTESQLQIAKNSLVDAGIEIGASVLPVLADAAGGVADLAGWFAALPAPVQKSVAGLGAVVGATGLVAGGMMKLIPAAADTIAAFKRIRDGAPGVTSALGKVAKGVGIAAVAFTAASALSSYGNSLNDVTLGANEAAAAAMKLADGADPVATLFDGMSTGADASSASTKELAADLDVLANGHWYEGLSNVETGLRNVFGAGLDTTDDIRQRIGEIGQGIAGLAQTDLPAATVAFESLWGSFGGTEEAGLNLLELMPELKNELAGIANAAGLDGTDSMVLLKLATGDLVPVVDEATGAVAGYNTAQGEAEGATEGATGAVEEQVDALAELQDQLQGTADLLLGVRGSARDFEAAMDDATAAVETNGKTLDISTEAGRANQEALDGIADSTHQWANEVEEAGGSAVELDGIMRQGRDAFIASAEAMGMGTEEAKALADELQLIPGEYQAEVDVHTDEAIVQIDEAAGGLQGIVDMEPHVDVSVDAGEAVISAEQAKTAIESIPAVSESIATMNTEPLQTEADGAFLLLAYLEAENPTPTAQLNDTNLVLTVQAATTRLDELNAMEPTPEVKAEKAVLERVVAGAKSDLNSIPDETIAKVQANAYGKSDVDALRSAISRVNSKSVSVTTTFRTIGTQPTITSGRVRGFGAAAEGGWLAPGLSGGGWVPGGYPGPGVDNVLWPRAAGAAGGGYLAQPLAGDEFVVKGSQSRIWGSALEAINNGASRAEIAALVGAQTGRGAVSVQNTFNEVGGEAAEIAATRVLNRVVGSLREA